MSEKLKTKSLLVALALFLTGCTSGFLNEGATRVSVSTVDSIGTPSRFKATYFHPSNTKTDLINPGDHFSVSLLSVFICSLRESRGMDIFTSDNSNPTGNLPPNNTNGCSYGGLIQPGEKDRTTRGEVAIIANMGESSDKVSLVTNPADRRDKGRVIFYSNDVRIRAADKRNKPSDLWPERIRGEKSCFRSLDARDG